jgi:LuxR family transcriptional regulator, maltose regulon positive regulatory protein
MSCSGGGPASGAWSATPRCSGPGCPGPHPPGGPGTSGLTTAELRLLPLLTTHLSFPEIAQELSLLPHTVKSEAWSIYRKLGASSRSQMIARSRELGLLEG